MELEYPYLVVSDVHFHDWSFGAFTTPEGINSRLVDTINEFKRAAEKLKEAGGIDIVITGDLFHSRGEIKPTIYNPVYDMFKELCGKGFRVHAIPGNHDLETAETTREGTCFKSFEAIEDFFIYYYNQSIDFHNGEMAVFLPWTEDYAKSINQVVGASEYWAGKKVTLFAHAGLSGVVSGVSNTIDPSTFESIKGIKNVFSGHFHNHKRFALVATAGDSGVYSVGALAHQSFKDDQSRAGFLIVKSCDEIEHHESECPKFVTYSDHDWCNPEKLDLDKFIGNYVRVKLDSAISQEEATAIKVTLESMGARKVINQAVIDNYKENEKVTEPVHYVTGGNKSFSEQFHDYVTARYEKEMAADMLRIYESDGLDE